MALPNLSGSNIQDTYQRVLHTDGSTLYDGTGSFATKINLNVREFIADGDAEFYNPTTFHDTITMQGDINLEGNVSASGTITAINIVPAANPSAGLRFQSGSTDVLNNLVVTGSITASGDISSSGIIIGSNLTGSNTGDQDLSSYSTIVQLNASGSTLQTNIDAKAPIASPSFTGAITASGNISSSGNVYANQVYAQAFKSINGSLISHSPSGATNIIGNDLDGLKLDGTSTNFSAGPITTGETFTSTNYISATNITASGNISASGDLFFNNIDGGTF